MFYHENPQGLSGHYLSFLWVVVIHVDKLFPRGGQEFFHQEGDRGDNPAEPSGGGDRGGDKPGKNVFFGGLRPPYEAKLLSE